MHLQAFDHHAKRTMHAPGSVRYVDDLFVFGDGRAQVRGWRDEIGQWLAQELDLRLEHPHTRVLSCRGHLDALGMRLRRQWIEPLPRTWRRVSDSVSRWLPAGDPEVLERSLSSRFDHAFFG